MWKTHKDKIPPPLRPVTSQCDSPSDRIAAVVKFILQQAMKCVSVNIPNSEHLKNKLQEKFDGKINENHILFTSDVNSLYTNVPLHHGIKIVTQFVEDHMDTIDMCGMEISDFDTLLKTVMKSGSFRFDKDFYHQCDELAMGVKPAPQMAIIYVFCTVEMTLLYDDFTYVPDAPQKPSDLM